MTATAPRFRFEELCASPPVAQDPRSYVVAEKAAVTNPDGQWQLQAQVLHWRGETWRGDQLAEDVFNTAVAALRSCQRTNPANSTVTELALWSTAPPLTAWPSEIDDTVLDALGAPLCTAYIGSCQ